MTTVPPIIDEAEQYVRRLALALTRVRDGECLCCYVARQVLQSGCDTTLRHALRYREHSAPRATALRERLRRVGAYCDCELFLNGYEPDPVVLPRETPDDVPYPPCAGVGRGSVRPCSNWIRLRRPW